MGSIKISTIERDYVAYSLFSVLRYTALINLLYKVFMSKNAVLLVNLGTPDDPGPKSVKRYLTQFLNDHRVINLPRLVRWPLVNLIIIPFRYKKSAHAYQSIWTSLGSPLRINTDTLTLALAQNLGDTYKVAMGMRYGNPSVASALKEIGHCERLTVIPLFPQYASASTGSALAEVMQCIAKQWIIPELRIINQFYGHPDFIRAYVDNIQHTVQGKSIDCLLLSYHGLPKNHLQKNSFCYRSQCFQTSRLIAQQLNLNQDQYVTSFQSRLGRTEWIGPYTEEILKKLHAQGIKNLAVACPSFVTDCLETLEEIDLRLRESWMALGGKSFTMIPCLNDSSIFMQALVNMITHC